MVERSPAHRTGSVEVEQERIRLGFVPLTDCAPLVIARERGFFREEGLDVTLSREPSWANVRDKLAVGELDGAQLLAPMSLSTSLGIDGVDVPLIVPMSLDLNGNAITVSRALGERLERTVRGTGPGPAAVVAAGAIAAGLRELIEEDRRKGLPPLMLAVVFPFSSHGYILRYWLASAGIDPDHDVRIVVAPPPAMVAMLEQGSIDGYCVGEPWNSLAWAKGIGRIVATSFDVWPCGPEKVLALRRAWAESHPATVRAIGRALMRACRWLDDLTNREQAVHVIAGLSFVDAPVDVVARSMSGRIGGADGGSRELPAMHVFFRHAATFPWRSQAAWFVAQMIRWGQIEKLPDLEGIIDSVYRPDLHREIAAELQFAAPTVDWKIEGQHDAPWTLEQATEPIPMSADRFLDERLFDPRDLRGYLDRFEIASMRVDRDEIPVGIGVRGCWETTDPTAGRS